MTKSIFKRLEDYYESLAHIIKGEAGLASIYPNSTDVGLTREQVYEDVLCAHLPACCNVYKGGFLFDQNGNESKQIDLIVTFNRSLQFKRADQSINKSFACIDGCIGIISIKSNLDSAQLKEALLNISSIPDKSAPSFPPGFIVENYDTWPFKVIYASDGISLETAMNTVNDFYETYPVPKNKRPDIIHVLNKYSLIYVNSPNKTSKDGTPLTPYTYYSQFNNVDKTAFPYIFMRMQNIAESMNQMNLSYDWLMQNLPFDF